MNGKSARRLVLRVAIGPQRSVDVVAGLFPRCCSAVYEAEIGVNMRLLIHDIISVCCLQLQFQRLVGRQRIVVTRVLV